MVAVMLSSARTRAGRLPAWPVLAALCLAAAVTLTVLGTRLTFFNDDWYFLLQRPGLESHGGLDTLLAPHNGNLVALLALLYKLLVAVFGLGSQLPFRLLIAATAVALGVLVYAFVGRRLGAAVGLAAALVVLFMGPAWEDLLFFGAMLDLGSSLALGLGALLAMEADTPRRNALACGLLLGAILFSNAGLPFLVGAVIILVARRRPRQLWIAAVPAALFALWWALDGSRAASYVTLHNIEHLPRYVFDALSIGLASATGLNHGGPGSALARGHILAAISLLAIVVWLLRGGRPTRISLAVGGTVLAFWMLTGAAFIPGRAPIASRYQLVSATLLIVLGGCLLGDARVARAHGWTRLLAPGLCVAAIAVSASNIDALIGGYRFLATQSRYVEADLGALRIAGGRAPPRLQLVDDIGRSPYVSGITAGRYFAETRAHGSLPHYTPDQISSAPAFLRQAADSVLAAAYRIHAVLATDLTRAARCGSLSSGSAGAPGPARIVASGVTQVVSRSASPLVIGVSRFAPASEPVYVAFMPVRATEVLRIPADSLARLPWRLSLLTPPGRTPGTVLVCR